MDLEVQEGKKNDQGKLDWSLLPIELLEPVARVFMLGAQKYAPKNYLGLTDVRINNALVRHLVEYLKGNSIDSESGETHLAHIICNCLRLIEKNTNV